MVYTVEAKKKYTFTIPYNGTVKTVVRCIQRNGSRTLIERGKNGTVLERPLVDWRRGDGLTNGNQRQTSRGCGNRRRRQQRQEIVEREMCRDDETAAVQQLVSNELFLGTVR